jgi:hypothetical protein
MIADVKANTMVAELQCPHDSKQANPPVAEEQGSL